MDANTEDMPDFMAMAAASKLPGDADDILDEADELEGMLEDALEEAMEEEQAKQAAHTIVTPQTIPSPPVLGPLHVQQTTQNALETMPRTSAGLIDVDKLNSEQLRVYNAAIMSLLTDEQQQRYESFRRSSLKEPMKRLMQILTGHKPDSQSKVNIALSSVTKSFVGELVEEARRVAGEGEGQKGGPVQPAHVMEAFQRLKSAGLVESAEGIKPKLRL